MVTTEPLTSPEEKRLPEPTAKEPEYVIDQRVENYLRLEKDLVNPELKRWLLGLAPRMVVILYGQPAEKKVITAAGKEIDQPEWYNRWIANFDIGTQAAREIYIQEGRRLFKEKWIYRIPYKYKKYALKPQIVLIFENSRLSSWEK